MLTRNLDVFLCETAFSLHACILRLASVLTQHSILPTQFPNGLSEIVFFMSKPVVVGMLKVKGVARVRAGEFVFILFFAL